MAAYPKDKLPNPMDIVWCRFPFDDKPGIPAVVCHPALVFATHEYKAAHYSVQVAYGTSTLKTDERPADFIVMSAVNLCYAGLAQATRFDLDRIKWLMWDDDWFIPQCKEQHDTPVIGRLPQEEIEDLRRLLKIRRSAGMSTP